jgi:hypothetical protein
MSQIFKLRPVLKNEREMEEEKNLFFELPRKNCEQMCPTLRKLQNQKISENQHRLHVLKRLMRTARVKHIDKNILPYLLDLDRSDSVVTEGEVSKRIYMDIFHSRNFNLYGALCQTVKHPPRKYLELKFLAGQLGVEFTQQRDERFVEVVEPTEEELIAKRHANTKRLTTEKWKIGYPEEYKPPVGFAKNPHEPYNSLGNEHYFSYDGLWKNGQMNGKGIYLFEDGYTYEGYFVNNRQHGEGRAEYPDNRYYEGGWKYGKFDGKGFYNTSEGLSYDGEYSLGKRHGYGKLIFPSGMYYEGEFMNNEPQGRGMMVSKMTGWSYEGTFEK